MAVRTNASADLLTRTTNLPPIGTFTLMGWFRIVTDRNAGVAFFTFGHATNGSAIYELQTNTDGTTLLLWQGATSGTGTNLTVGTWYHLALVVSGTGANQCKAYLNGVENISVSGNVNNTAGKLWINGSVDSAEWLDGRVADVKVYGRALTVDEIKAEMWQNLPVDTTGINAYYPLWNGVGTDYSPNGYSLTAGGSLGIEEGPPIPWQLDNDGEDEVTYVIASNTYTASGAVTVGAATTIGSAAFTKPTYTAVGTASIAPATTAGVATFEDRTRTATGVVTVAPTTASGAATFAKPAYTGAGVVAVAPPSVVGAATFTKPTYMAAGSATIGRTTAAGTAIFSTAVFQAAGATTLAPATASGSAAFTKPTYAGAGVVNTPPATAAGVAAFSKPTYTGAGAVNIFPVTAAGVGMFAPLVYTGVGAATIRGASALGAATFTGGTVILPDPADVLAGVVYDVNNLPTPGQVRFGVVYG